MSLVDSNNGRTVLQFIYSNQGEFESLVYLFTTSYMITLDGLLSFLT